MKTLELVLAAVMTIATPAALHAQDAQDAQNAAQEQEESPLFVDATSLDAFLWVARPVVVFADSPNDPRYVEQMALLREREGDLRARDVVVVTDTDPGAQTAVRTQLRPRGFMLAIVGKDGKVAQRKPSPWHVREITRSIDKMPIRRQEIRDAKQAAGAG